jgi:hypothetical protein
MWKHALQCSACQLLSSLLPLLLLCQSASCNANSSSLARSHQKLLQEPPGMKGLRQQSV